MLYRVDEFCHRVSQDLNGFIDDLIQLTGRNNNDERKAWARSLPKVSVLLSDPTLKDFHIYLNENNSGGVIVEYKLPSSSSWCDVVLLGDLGERPSIVIIELKDWDISNDTASSVETLVNHQGSLWLHPSDQVRGYTNYCSRFHSAVLSENASVSGCVYFTSAKNADIYKQGVYQNITSLYPIFSTSDEDLSDNFPSFLKKRLKKPNENFAHKFEKGIYKQDRNLILQVANNFRNRKPGQLKPFELLDEQRKGFEICVSTITKALNSFNKKQVIIIEGPPGSGKSALAANLWAECVDLLEGKENVVFTTTSSSQKKNWESLFEQVGGDTNAGDLVKASNMYNPGITNQWINQQREDGIEPSIDSWRENVKKVLQDNQIAAPDNLFSVSIVDESHALIDPEVKHLKGVPNAGWDYRAGPQAWHIIRCSRISVFLLDSEQSFRMNESTTVKKIQEFAKEFNSEIHLVELKDSQFRCGGSIKYMNWLDKVLDIDSSKPGIFKPNNDFHIETVDYLEELDDILRKKNNEGYKIRLASTFSKEWITKDRKSHRIIGDPHILPDSQKDFHITYKKDGQEKVWSRIWNYAPKENYTYFIQAPPGSAMHKDPLCEVGCPYVIRGFDFDYIGLLWFKDLYWRNNKWNVDLKKIFESTWRIVLSDAKKGDQDAYDTIVRQLLRGYRILLTRPFKGVYIWFEDNETREYVKSLIENE
jgi:DUF2075 family protein